MGVRIMDSGLTAATLLIASFLLPIVSGHTKGDNVIAYFDAYLPPGTYCAPRRPVTGWTVNYDRYRPADNTGTAVEDSYFSPGAGTYTTPAGESITAVQPLGARKEVTVTSPLSEMPDLGMLTLLLLVQEILEDLEMAGNQSQHAGPVVVDRGSFGSSTLSLERDPTVSGRAIGNTPDSPVSTQALTEVPI